MSADLTTNRPPAEPGHWHPDNWVKHFGRETRVNLKTPELAGVRVVVLLTFDTQGDVDAAVPGYQAGAGHWANGAVNYCDAAERQYDMRGGVQRVLRILRTFNAVATFPTCGATAEWYPDVISSIAEAGHEVASHGYWHKPLNEMSADEEAVDISRTTAAIERVTGARPYGWRSPMYTITERTIPLLAEQGYEYDSDLHNDDEPYLLTTDSGSLVEIPGGMDDFGMWLSSVPHAIHHGGIPYGNPLGITNIITSQFDVLYDEGRELTRVFQYCMHPKITGRPFRSVSLSAFLQHATQRPGVRFMTMLELARLCRTSLQ
jgi:peptidoglycan/xylan/chitin deacetylase (PgdA/CDA1 family)